MTVINCNSTDDCYYLYECINKICEHKDIWPPNALQLLTYILLPFLIGIANVGGLGGAIVKVPLLMLMLNYPLKIATYMSYCIMFGSVITNVILLLFQKHPYHNRPLIDFNIALVLNPTVLLGTTIGYYVNVMLPDLVVTILFLVFLLIVTPYLYKRGMDLWKEEKLNQKSNQNKQSSKNFNQNEHDNKFYYQEEETNLIEKNDELKQFTENESKRFPRLKLSLMICCFLTIQLLKFIRGDKEQSIIGIQKCSQIYWLLTSFIAIIVLFFSYISVTLLKKQEKLKKQINYPIDKYDITFSNKNCLKLFSTGSIAGFLTGALGAGAGFTTVPVLLYLKVHPRVSSATSGFNYIWIALTLIINVILGGLLKFSEIALFTSLAILGGFGFSKIIYYLVDKYKKTSLIIMFVFVIAIINIFGNIIYLVKQADQYGWNSLTEYPNFCP